MRFLLTSPCIRTSKSDVIEELLVRATIIDRLRILAQDMVGNARVLHRTIRLRG